MVRLFMSIDITGSTAYKARLAARGSSDWVKFFNLFYANFPVILTGRVGFEFRTEKHCPEIAVWKSLGDEIILVAEPRSAKETALLMRALFQTMEAYEREQLQRLPLRLKGSAWLAAFPEPNVDIAVSGRIGDQDIVYMDFIGPDIDLGFRLTKFASPSFIVASLPLVEVLLSAGDAVPSDFHIVGSEPLKGVLFDQPYPIIWVRPHDAPIAVEPWEEADNPRIKKAREARATVEAVQKAIGGMRGYLRKMHDMDFAPIAFD